MKTTTIQILSEDVKKLVKQISSYEEQGLSFYDANAKAVDEILPSYDFFWQLVILAAICRRCNQVVRGGFCFMDPYLKDRIPLCKRIIKHLRKNGPSTATQMVGTEVNFSHDDWNDETKKLMDELSKTDETFRYNGIVDARQMMLGL
jgi:hypothetical protein